VDRAAILSESTTHVGVGITYGDEVSGRREIFVAQVFIRVSPKADPAATREARPTADLMASPPPPPSPPTARTWVEVPSGVIVEWRTEGTDEIEPDAATKAELAKSRRRASGIFRLCLDDQGAVVLTRAVIETGYLAYDEKILREIRAWKFRPPVIGGQPRGACSDVWVSYPPVKTARRRI